ncbi:DUF541 domain-containing protein [Mesobaculum littorinae]|uniref:DUF541 domain-containing protein n=1 Tax=Mesobaculum littorinae TaxID=2486419 RepID=A0A438ALS8_9RHOB|nr:SIMPL domain-containing protein [Mesobaculum littorinae]RVV99801.1 DUF541 domain-containing protein [Mesobaculum littorinae]
MNTRIISALTVALLSGTAAYGQADTPPAPRPMAAAEAGRITVQGTGTTRLAPDMATITLGVTAEAPEAADAMADTQRRAAEVLDTLVAAGVEDRDVQTSSVELYPRRDDSEASRQQGEPPIVGYVATNRMTVRVRDLADLGPLMDDVVGAGSNLFQGLSFGLSEPEPAEDEALADAVEDARRKAEILAQAAGVTLGQLERMDESGGNRPYPPQMMEMRAVSDSAGGIAEGELEISANVLVTWRVSEGGDTGPAAPAAAD